MHGAASHLTGLGVKSRLIECAQPKGVDTAGNWPETLKATVSLEAGCRACRMSLTGRDVEQRCHMREQLIDLVQREYPQYLPQLRVHNDSPRANENQKADAKAYGAL